MAQISLSSIRVITRLYVMEWGKMPKGRGAWAWSIGNADAFDDISKVFWTNSMTYGEAVKVAKLEAQKRGVDVVYVLP